MKQFHFDFKKGGAKFELGLISNMKMSHFIDDTNNLLVLSIIRYMIIVLFL